MALPTCLPAGLCCRAPAQVSGTLTRALAGGCCPRSSPWWGHSSQHHPHNKLANPTCWHRHLPPTHALPNMMRGPSNNSRTSSMPSRPWALTINMAMVPAMPAIPGLVWLQLCSMGPFLAQHMCHHTHQHHLHLQRLSHRGMPCLLPQQTWVPPCLARLLRLQVPWAHAQLVWGSSMRWVMMRGVTSSPWTAVMARGHAPCHHLHHHLHPCPARSWTWRL